MTPASLRGRLLLAVVALTAVCLVALGGIVYAQQREFLLESADDQARAAVGFVGRALDGDEGPGRPGHGGRPDRDGRPRDGDGGPPVLTLPPGTYGERRAADGTRIGSPVVFSGEAPPSPPELPAGLPPRGRLSTVPSQDGSLEYRVAASDTPGASSTTIVAVPLSGVDAQLDRLLLVEAVVIGLVLLLLAGVGSLVVRLGLRPLDRIGATAGRIAAGDYSQRVAPDDDRTEVGRLGRALNAMLDQIERAFAEREASERRLRQFLSDASHELRTPLTSIRGYAELYRMGAASDPAGARKAIGRIEQEAARMGVLVEDLLVLARLDEVRERVREPVDLARLAADAADDASAAARDRRIAVERADADAVVCGDGDQLRQVVGNLVRNALVHTPAGTPVELAVARADGRVRLEVRDHGPGLPVADGADLFDRFWRADPARGRGPAGAGLGLAIVSGIVAAHDGEVRAETAPEGGARFTVELPALVRAPAPVTASRGSSMTGTGSSDAHPRRTSRVARSADRPPDV